MPHSWEQRLGSSRTAAGAFSEDPIEVLPFPIRNANMITSEAHAMTEHHLHDSWETLATQTMERIEAAETAGDQQRVHTLRSVWMFCIQKAADTYTREP